jgi:hypothetical protein
MQLRRTADPSRGPSVLHHTALREVRQVSACNGMLQYASAWLPRAQKTDRQEADWRGLQRRNCIEAPDDRDRMRHGNGTPQQVVAAVLRDAVGRLGN